MYYVFIHNTFPPSTKQFCRKMALIILPWQSSFSSFWFLTLGYTNIHYKCISCYPENILYLPKCGFHKTSGGEKQRKEERQPLGKIYFSPDGWLKICAMFHLMTLNNWNVSTDEFTSAAKHNIAVIYNSSCEIAYVNTITRSSAYVHRYVAALVYGFRCWNKQLMIKG